MNIIAIVLLFALIGGGIYLWVRWQRNKIKAKRQELVANANLLDSSGNVTSEAFDRIIGKGDSDLSNPTKSSLPGSDPEVNADRQEQGATATGGAIVTSNGATSNGETAASNDATASSNGATAHSPKPIVKIDPTAEKFQLAAASIEELCEKLLAAWSKATNANSLYEKACRDRSNAVDELSYSHGTSRARSSIKSGAASHTALVNYIEKLRGLQLSIRSNSNKRALTVEALLLLPNQAKEAWNLLNQALLPFPESFFNSNSGLAPHLVTLGLAAHQVKSVSKSSIEGLLQEASEAQENAEAVRAEASTGEPSEEQRTLNASSDTAECKRDLSARTIKALQEIFAADDARVEASSHFSELDSLTRTRFKAPQKPTPEEVMRYLASVEDWTVSVHTTKRQAVEQLSAAKKLLQQAKASTAELQGAYQALSKKLLDGRDEDNIALAMAIALIISDLNSSLERRSKSLLTLEQENAAVKVPTSVTSETAADLERIKALRVIARTAGFALAQATVAENKLSQLRYDEPSGAPSQPKVDRDQTFASHLGRFGQFVKKKESHISATNRWEAEKEIVAGALAARSEKVRESNKAMSTACATTIKSFSATTCDQLRVVAGMLEKLVLLNKPFEK
ncbi:MAG: hypothetical protein WC714_18555 [Candidatus Obscuribacterales bacterium]|jgi:hypothetical protein